MKANIRQWLHAATVGLAAISGGIIVFTSDADAQKVIVGLATLSIMVIDSYLYTTTTGISKAQARRRADSILESRLKLEESRRKDSAPNPRKPRVESRRVK